jgi:hypothetical protein
MTNQEAQTALLESLQTFDNDLLTVLAKGELDVQVLFRTAIAQRGLDPKGEWVGFAKAKEVWQVVGQ